MHAIIRCRSISSKNNADTSLKVCCIVALEYGWRMDRYLSRTRQYIFSAERKKVLHQHRVHIHTYVICGWPASEQGKRKMKCALKSIGVFQALLCEQKKADPPSFFREDLLKTDFATFRTPALWQPIYGTKGLNSLDDENSTRKVIQPIQCVNVGKVTYLCQRSC